MAFLRAAAYLRAGNPQQALRDIKLALVYGPQATVINPARGGSDSQALVAAGPRPARSGSGGGTNKDAVAPAPPAVIEVPCWPAALALQSAIQEAMGDNVPAVLAIARAAELDPESEAYAAALQRLMRRIPEEYARVLQVCVPSVGMCSWVWTVAARGQCVGSRALDCSCWGAACTLLQVMVLTTQWDMVRVCVVGWVGWLGGVGSLCVSTCMANWTYCWHWSTMPEAPVTLAQA